MALDLVIKIQNFRCLRNVNFKLGEFTVLVGPNASGKTAIADALTLDRGIVNNDHWMRRPEEPPRFSRGGAQYASHPRGAWGEGRTKYRFQPTSLRRSIQANTAWNLSEDGGNLANLISTLSRPRQESFVADFTKLVPVYQDVTVRASGGMHHLEFQDRWDEAVWYKPDDISDGSILTAAFVALGYQRNTPRLAVFEDPDHGLHPYLQRHIIGLFRGLASGAIGPERMQVVCTTHSKAFLDILEPEEVRFLTRDRETGETVIQAAPVDDPKWTELYDKFQGSLGDIWMTGAIGGVPGI